MSSHRDMTSTMPLFRDSPTFFMPPFGETVSITEFFLLFCTCFCSNRMFTFNLLAILDVILCDLFEFTMWCMELGDKGEGLVGVHCEVGARSIKVWVSKTEFIDVTTISVHRCNVPVPLLAATFLVLFANSQTWIRCRMSSEGSRV